MNTLDYLAACKKRLGIESDYALAKALNVPQSSISNYRTGRSRIGDEVALSVAQILGVNPLVVIAHANAERAKTPETRARWLGLVENFLFLLPQAKFAGPERRRMARTPLRVVTG